MATFSITIPDEIGFTRQATAFVFDATKLTDAIAAALLVHGIVQKVGDSAAGTTPGNEARTAMADTAESLFAGIWSTRGAGTSVDPIVRHVRNVMRALMGLPQFAGRKTAYKAFSEQNDRELYLDQWFAELPEPQAEKVRASAARALALENEKKQTVAALAGDADFAPAESGPSSFIQSELIAGADVETVAKKAGKKAKAK